VVFELGAQRADILLGTDLQHGVAGGTMRGEQGARHFKLGGQVALVEHDQRGDVLRFGGHEAAGDQIVGKARLGGDDDDDLADIRGDQFLFPLVRAVKQAGTRHDLVDHALVRAAQVHLDAVAAGNFAALGTGVAQGFAAIAQSHHVLATKRGDDSTGLRADRRAHAARNRLIRMAAGGCES
jgi:hypothetical protein